MAKYTELCNQVLEQIGGKENVRSALHCMTRLRLNLADNSKVNMDALKGIQGVLGAQFSGDQLQVIIGPTVSNVYTEFCEIAGVGKAAAVEENLDKDKESFSIKNIPSKVLSYVSGSVAPALPIMLGAGFFRMFYSILGTGLLNVLPEDSMFMQTLYFIGNAGFYFLPIFIAWGAAKKLNTSVPIALALVAILLEPTVLGIIGAGVPFNVYGFLPMQLNDYSQSVLPALLTVWVMSYVHKYVDKFMPKSLKVIFVPFVTLVIMVPLMLCALAPLGNWIGILITKLIELIHSFAGPVAVALVGALWMFMIATGMHIAVIQLAIINIMTTGNDPIVFVGSTVANITLMGLALAYFIRAKGEEKAIAGGNAVTLIVGGLAEPTIFGVLLRNKKAMLYQMIGAFIGALIAGITNAAFYTMAASNFMNVLGFSGGPAGNFVWGLISCLVGAAVALLLGVIFGFEDKKAKAA